LRGNHCSATDQAKQDDCQQETYLASRADGCHRGIALLPDHDKSHHV